MYLCESNVFEKCTFSSNIIIYSIQNNIFVIDIKCRKLNHNPQYSTAVCNNYNCLLSRNIIIRNKIKRILFIYHYLFVLNCIICTSTNLSSKSQTYNEEQFSYYMVKCSTYKKYCTSNFMECINQFQPFQDVQKLNVGLN